MTLDGSISSCVYSVLAKPVTLVTSRTMSNRNLKGGFDSNLSDNLGLVMIPPNMDCVVASNPSHLQYGEVELVESHGHRG